MAGLRRYIVGKGNNATCAQCQATIASGKSCWVLQTPQGAVVFCSPGCAVEAKRPRKNPRVPKGTPTQINLSALDSALRVGHGRIPDRIERVHVPHLRRCLAAGLIEKAPEGGFRLTRAGVDALKGRHWIDYGVFADPPPEWSAHLTRENPEWGTARFIKAHMPGWKCDVNFYELDPPLEGYKFVLTSAASPGGHPETYIFPADEDGNRVSASELPGSFRGALDHEKALQKAGYEVINMRRNPGSHVCELHGMYPCSICHKQSGECDYGDCNEPATHWVQEWVHPKEGPARLGDRRAVCEKCYNALLKMGATPAEAPVVPERKGRRHNPTLRAEHSARQLDPDRTRYSAFSRKTIKRSPPVHAIFGWTKAGKSEIVSLRFPADAWTPAKAKAWLKSHDFSARQFVAAARRNPSEDLATSIGAAERHLIMAEQELDRAVLESGMDPTLMQEAAAITGTRARLRTWARKNPGRGQDEMMRSWLEGQGLLVQ